MGCDWINGEEACFGYAVEYVEVFQGTRFDVENIHSEECMEEYEDTDIPHSELRNAWNSFTAEKYPQIVENKIQPIIGCKEIAGGYEAVKDINYCHVLFGFKIGAFEPTDDPDNNTVVYAMPGFKFPKNMVAIVEEFIVTFREHELATGKPTKHAIKRRKVDNPKPIKVKSQPEMVIFVQ